MTKEIQAKFEQVRDRLKQLGNAVADLAQNHADILDSPDIQDALLKFRQAYEESTARLANPTFTIATLGTTSSGKSTIVNALIGRKIAPIEAGEMSGGVLKIKHSKEFKLSVAETEGAQWETGTWTDLNDVEIYDRIRNGVMLPYHQARLAPQVTTHVPILPVEDASLLGLPEGIGIKFIDLPGLKSIQDKDNLKIIQQQVHKAFSLVTLDYGQVDDRHRKRLLEELKRVVEYLQGRTDSMIFILNRVDQRGQDDLSIDKRIKQLQLEIQETLNLDCCSGDVRCVFFLLAISMQLKEKFLRLLVFNFSTLIQQCCLLPDIIPLSGRFLYYAQCAWGTNSIYGNSEIDSETRLEFLKGMLLDCSSLIKLNTSEDKKLKRWFRDLEDRVDDGEIIDDKSMRKVLSYVQDWSGGRQLWDCIRKRVQESFSELVIVPALIDVYDNYDCLVKAIDLEVNIAKIQEKEQIELKQAQIVEGSNKLCQEIEDICSEFQDFIEKSINVLKKNDPKEESKITQKIEEKGYQGLQSFISAISELEGDLIDNLIALVRDAFEENKGTYELEENLTRVVTPTKAKDIAKAYDLVGKKLTGFHKDFWFMSKKCCEDDKESVRSLEHAERAVRSLYFAMRKGITARAEFVLQGQSQKFEKGLKDVVDHASRQLIDVCTQELPELNLDEVIIADFQKSSSQSLPTLPDDIFQFSDNIHQKNTSKREIVSARKSLQYYTEGSCFKEEKNRWVNKAVYGNVKYRELKLPTPKNMARQWAEGINKEKEKIWDIIRDWTINYFDVVSHKFDRSITKAMRLAVRAFEKQLIIIEKNLVKQEEYWKEFKQQKDAITAIRQQLEKESINN